MSSKIEASNEHHQQNGNIGIVIPYIDSSEKSLDMEGDRSDSKRVADEKAHQLEAVGVLEEARGNADEANKEDEYVHSLWKFPFGRSCFIKVRCKVYSLLFLGTCNILYAQSFLQKKYP